MAILLIELDEGRADDIHGLAVPVLHFGDALLAGDVHGFYPLLVADALRESVDRAKSLQRPFLHLDLQVAVALAGDLDIADTP